MIPIQTREALEALGLTDEQVQGAWDIIIDHLGIASPPKGHLDIYAEPGEPVDVRKPETKHTIPITEMIKEEVHRLKDEPSPPPISEEPKRVRTSRKRGAKW